MIASWGTAVVMLSLGAMNVYTGCLSVAFFGSTIPAFVGITCVDRGGLLWRLQLGALALFGLGMAGLGAEYTGNYVDDLSCWS